MISKPKNIHEQKKGKPTPPAPQNGLRRARYFYPTRDTDPHSKAELQKIALDRQEKGIK